MLVVIRVHSRVPVLGILGKVRYLYGYNMQLGILWCERGKGPSLSDFDRRMSPTGSAGDCQTSVNLTTPLVFGVAAWNWDWTGLDRA